MLTLPPDIMAILAPFAPAFSQPIWRRIQVLVAGSILAPGQRIMTSVLRALGLEHLSSFGTYHRVLSRAVWSSLTVSRILLGLLVATFAPTGPLVLGIDETIERRRGAKIITKGIYRDPVRSSHSHFVKSSGLRWICLMLLVPIPWADRTWALPFLTVLAPSERYNTERGRRHKAITDWARQTIRLLHRWYPARRLVVVADSEYAAIDFLAAVRPVASIVTRLRLDARLFAPAPPRRPRQMGRPRLVGKGLPSLTTRTSDPVTPWTSLTMSRWYGERDRPMEIASDTAIWYRTGLPPVPIRWVLIRDPQDTFPTQALLCTDLAARPEPILAWRRRGSGRTEPSVAPRQPSSACSPSSHSSRMTISPFPILPSVRLPGTPRPPRPSSMPLPWFGGTSGPI